MIAGARIGSVEAVVFDLDEVLVPFETVRAWQWAWKPQGPLLGERRTQTALRRERHAWDRRRWLGLTGKAPATDLAALREHLANTLARIAGHAVGAEESEAVVRRMLRPAGEVERFSDAAPALERLRLAGVKVGVLTSLPLETARWILRRQPMPESLLLGAGDPPGPVVPARDAFRAAVDRLGAEPSATAFVGDLYWSDVRAAHRAGLRAVLLDRSGAWPNVGGDRLVGLAELEAVLARDPASDASDRDGVEPV